MALPGSTSSREGLRGPLGWERESAGPGGPDPCPSWMQPAQPHRLLPPPAGQTQGEAACGSSRGLGSLGCVGGGGSPRALDPLGHSPQSCPGARGGQLLQPLPAGLPPTPSSVQRVSTSSLPWHFWIFPGDLGCHCPNCCSSLTLLLWGHHPSFLPREYSAPVARVLPSQRGPLSAPHLPSAHPCP